MEPGSPWENGCIESINNQLTDELPNRLLYSGLREVTNQKGGQATFLCRSAAAFMADVGVTCSGFYHITLGPVADLARLDQEVVAAFYVAFDFGLCVGEGFAV